MDSQQIGLNNFVLRNLLLGFVATVCILFPVAFVLVAGRDWHAVPLVFVVLMAICPLFIFDYRFVSGKFKVIVGLSWAAAIFFCAFTILTGIAFLFFGFPGISH